MQLRADRSRGAVAFASTAARRRKAAPRSSKSSPSGASRALELLESPLKADEPAAGGTPGGAAAVLAEASETVALSKRDKYDVARAVAATTKAEDRARAASIKAETLREQLQKVTDSHLLEKVSLPGVPRYSQQGMRDWLMMPRFGRRLWLFYAGTPPNPAGCSNGAVGTAPEIDASQNSAA